MHINKVEVEAEVEDYNQVPFEIIFHFIFCSWWKFTKRKTVEQPIKNRSSFLAAATIVCLVVYFEKPAKKKQKNKKKNQKTPQNLDLGLENEDSKDAPPWSLCHVYQLPDLFGAGENSPIAC